MDLCYWQIIACLIGLFAGFVPGVSFTAPFWGLDLAQGSIALDASESPVRVLGVKPGSPAEEAGFQTGDAFQDGGKIDDVSRLASSLQSGQAHSFPVMRQERSLVLEARGIPPKLAAVWYADEWYPIAGMLFLCLGILVFATAPLTPAPLWRSIPVTIAGLGISIGFGVSLAVGSVFMRFRVYQVYPMGLGDEWYCHQGLIGIAAGLLVAVTAAAEIRGRLTRPRIAASCSLTPNDPQH